MVCNETGDVVLHYTYPEVRRVSMLWCSKIHTHSSFQISACGCSTLDNHYLAFIAGNDLCSQATEYLCHVFYCANQSKARDIIGTIAQGFERTKNAV